MNRAVILIVGFIFLFELQAKANTEKNKQVDKSPQVITQLNFVTGPDYKPLIDEKAPDGGPLIKRLKQLLAKKKIKLNVKFMPWARAEKMTEEAMSDGTLPYVFSEERNTKFLFSNSIHKSSARLFINKKLDIAHIDQTKSMRMCRPIGYDMEKLKPFIEKHQWKFESASGLSECFKMLNSQRVDLVPISEEVGWYTISSTFDGVKDQFKTLDTVLYEVSYYVIVGKSHPKASDIIATVNLALESEK